MQHLFVFVFSSLFLLSLAGTQRSPCRSSNLRLPGDDRGQTCCTEQSQEGDKETFGLCRLSNCAEYRLAGYTESGIYKIYPRQVFQKQEPFEVFCDMETDGGGWTVFQRRGDYTDLPRVNFTRNWNDYSVGFGNLLQEFWLGNNKLFVLTNQDYVTLRVELEDFEKDFRFAIYDSMIVADENDEYRLTLGAYHGDAGDSLTYHSGFTFVTSDRDRNTCVVQFKGGWWYNACHEANLNGQYLKGVHESFADGVNWKAFKGYHYSLKTAEMKIRPLHFKNSFNV